MIAAWFRSLSPRERGLIVFGGIVVAASLIYVSVLEPRYQRLQQLRSQVSAQQADLDWMRARIEQHRALLSARETPGAERPPLLTVVEQTTTEAGLRAGITRMQPAEQGQVRVWFDNVPFDRWLRWVDSLGALRIGVVAVTVDRADDGRVNVRLTLGS